MTLPFFKYHGTGNDFILIDNRIQNLNPSEKQVVMLCDRHFGIGADGMMLLTTYPGYDFGMRYFNSDGHESTMCGNGGRCMTLFAKTLGLVADKARFMAIDGEHLAEILHPDHTSALIRLRMKDADSGTEYQDGHFIDTGSPHFVVFTQDVRSADVFRFGRALRHDLRFAPGGANVDFVEPAGDHLVVRTYERGVEDETLSCGTGVTASALAMAIRDPGNPGFYLIKTCGGDLKVSFRRDGQWFREVWLEGEARFVFSGNIDLPDE